MAIDEEPEWVRRGPPVVDERPARALRVVAAGAGGPPPPFDGRSYSDIAEEEWEWLWTGRIPLGEVSYLEGYAGDGKSSVVADIAARVSSGATLPDDPNENVPSGVLWFTTEESPSKTIRRRLRIAGATMANIVDLDVARIDDDRRGLPRFRFPSGQRRLSATVAHYSATIGERVRLLVVDGVFSIFDAGMDANDAQDVREVLGSLRRVAIEHNLAVLAIRHPSKAKGGLAQHRAGGSTAWGDVARTSWLVGQEPATEWRDRRRVLVPVKANAGRGARGLMFSTEWDEAAKEVRVRWGEGCDLDADAVYAAREARTAPAATDAQVEQALVELRQHDVSKLTSAKARRAIDGMGLPGDAGARAFRRLLDERRSLAQGLLDAKRLGEKDED